MNDTACRDYRCRFIPGELDDLLGHDRIGHQVRNLLGREGVQTREQLAAIPDARLLEFENFGVGCLARVRSRVPAPASLPASFPEFSISGGPS